MNRFISATLTILLVAMNVTVAEVVGPGVGEMTKVNIYVGNGCTVESLTVSWLLDSLTDGPLVHGEYMYLGNCQPASEFVIWLRVEGSGNYGYVRLSPPIPNGPGRWTVSLPRFPDWGDLLCGYKGTQKRDCRSPSSAEEIWTNGRVTDFDVPWIGPQSNVPPTADAGTDQRVDGKVRVSLSGSGTDSDGTVERFEWTQTAGPTVTLSGAETRDASFIAPKVGADENMVFQLTVTDDDGATGVDTIRVTVGPSPGFLVGQVYGHTAFEGATAEFTLRLTAQPSSKVTVPVRSSDTSQGAVEQTQLVFTSGDWDRPQVVVVEGTNPDATVGEQDFVIQLGPAQSLDTRYDGMQISAVNMNVFELPLRAIHAGGAGGTNWTVAKAWKTAGRTGSLIPADYVEYLNRLHVDWVGLFVTLYYDTKDGTVKSWDADDVLRQFIREFREHGFNVYLSLYLYSPSRLPIGSPGHPETGVPSRADILPEDWPWSPSHQDHHRFVAQFWNTYADQAVSFGRLAEEEDVRMFSLGKANPYLFRTRAGGGGQDGPWPNHFRQELNAMVGRVRDVYSGPLTYDRSPLTLLLPNFFGFEPGSDPIWEDLDLDVIGINAWFSLTDTVPSTVTSLETLEASYEEIFRGYLMPLQERNPGRPVMFLEHGAIDAVEAPAWLGYGAADVKRGLGDANGNGLDDGQETQANIYQALFNTMGKYPGVVNGVFWWGNTIASDALWATVQNPNFAIRGKLAEDVVRSVYEPLETTDGPASNGTFITSVEVSVAGPDGLKAMGREIARIAPPPNVDGLHVGWNYRRNSNGDRDGLQIYVSGTHISVEYWVNGVIQSTASYRGGKPSGSFNNYTNGELDGVQIEFFQRPETEHTKTGPHQSAQLASNRDYSFETWRSGTPDGPFGTYVNGVPGGVFGNRSDGQLDGALHTISETGWKLESWQNGTRHGAYGSYDRNGQKHGLHGSYTNDSKDGGESLYEHGEPGQGGSRNHRPEPVGIIGDITLTRGVSMLVFMPRYFTDPDEIDPNGWPVTNLTYRAESDDTNVAMAGCDLYCRIRPVFGGTATITVTATDPGGLTAVQRFKVTVPVNRPPQAISANVPEEITFSHSNLIEELSVRDFFADPDGDTLRYSYSTEPPGLLDNPFFGQDRFGRTFLSHDAPPGASGIATVTACDRGITTRQITALETYTPLNSYRLGSYIDTLDPERLCASVSFRILVQPEFTPVEPGEFRVEAPYCKQPYGATSAFYSPHLEVEICARDLACEDGDGMTMTIDLPDHLSETSLRFDNLTNSRTCKTIRVPFRGPSSGRETVNVPYELFVDSKEYSWWDWEKRPPLCQVGCSPDCFVGPKVTIFGAIDAHPGVEENRGEITVRTPLSSVTRQWHFQRGFDFSEEFRKNPWDDSAVGSRGTIRIKPELIAEINDLDDCPTDGSGNRAPVAAQGIPDQRLTVGESMVITLSDYFSDPDDDVLTYDATSSDSNVLQVVVSGSSLSMRALAEGDVEVSLTATDPAGLPTELVFKVGTRRTETDLLLTVECGELPQAPPDRRYVCGGFLEYRKNGKYRCNWWGRWAGPTPEEAQEVFVREIERALRVPETVFIAFHPTPPRYVPKSNIMHSYAPPCPPPGNQY